MVETLKVLAQVRGADVAEVERATVENTRRLFGLPRGD
jgi:Tat protein secretion system quality control protein TatD with DNase activity